MKKIVRILTRMNGGGPAFQIEVLKDLEDTITIYGSISEHETDLSYLIKESKQYYIPELQREINLKNDLKALWKIYQIIRKERPDIIHTHTSKAGLLGRAAGIAFKAPNIDQVKLYHTYHGNILTGYFKGFKMAIIILIERFLGYFTTNLIAISNQQKQELLNHKIGDEKKIKIIELGLDLDRFYREKNNERV